MQSPEYGNLSIGVNFFAMHYANNQNAFTHGMGGYFSPQGYFLGNVPFTFVGHYGTNWHYNVVGGLRRAGIPGRPDSAVAAGGGQGDRDRPEQSHAAGRDQRGRATTICAARWPTRSARTGLQAASLPPTTRATTRLLRPASLSATCSARSRPQPPGRRDSSRATDSGLLRCHKAASRQASGEGTQVCSPFSAKQSLIPDPCPLISALSFPCSLVPSFPVFPPSWYSPEILRVLGSQ